MLWWGSGTMIINPCKDALPCKDRIQLGELSTEGRAASFDSISHTQNVDQKATILGVQYSLNNLKRDFRISKDVTGAMPDGYYVQTNNGLIKCYTAGTAPSAQGFLKEDIESTTIVPMYLNIQDELFVYKKVHETIKFSPSIMEKVIFRTRGGYQEFMKYVIKKTGDKEHLVGTEEFHIIYKGIDSIVHSSEYDFNPFPETSRQTTWGFYGGGITHTTNEEYDPSVRQILVYPNPPSLGIPQDFNPPSINMYGFYDYGEIEGGFIRNTRAKLDGGFDYWYPEWMRHMTAQPIMKQWADSRFSYIWDHIQPPRGEWTAPAPENYPFPFGSFVQDLKGNYIHSCIFTDRNLQHIIYNNSNLNDVFNSILNLGQTLHGGEAVFFPITIVSSASEPTTVEGIGTTSDPNLLTDENGLAITDPNNEVIYA